MDIGARARGADQHPNRIAGRASAVGDRGAQKPAGARDQDEVTTAAIQFRHDRDLTHDRCALKPDCTFPENASTAISWGSPSSSMDLGTRNALSTRRGLLKSGDWAEAMGYGDQLIAVVGLAFEARIAAGPGVRVICSGNGKNLAASLSSAIAEGATGV